MLALGKCEHWRAIVFSEFSNNGSSTLVTSVILSEKLAYIIGIR